VALAALAAAHCSGYDIVVRTKALETASVVRSYSSKTLGDGSEAETSAASEMKTLVLADLDIGEIIGSGSAGTVKLAVHIPTGMRVAVKIIPKRKFFMNKKLEETTNRELAMLDRISTFDHPHIVRTFGYINDLDNVYIALELCEGGELLEQLEHIGNYTEHDAATIMMNCTDTLGYLHARGIVHRDIKPENLLLKVKGSPDSVKLADFGLANIMEGKDSLQTVCGSPAYMAPEVHNMKDYDEKCDMWSMGVMLFLLLSGSLPFLPPRLVEKAELQSYTFEGKLWECVSDAAKDLVVRLLVADPKLRYSVTEVLAHPWITGENREDIDLNATKKAIALFSAKRKFKGMAHAVIAIPSAKTALRTRFLYCSPPLIDPESGQIAGYRMAY
jgi:calcium-dependent protein kinase